jgi:hypothetical protein
LFRQKSIFFLPVFSLRRVVFEILSHPCLLALSFDNPYRLAYLGSGVKRKLQESKGRVGAEFRPTIQRGLTIYSPASRMSTS